MIRTISAGDVHRITSGQVIVDMASIVKEVVENSIDAHATAVDVQLRNYGLGSIEITDNGDGIAPEDFKSIALKHYTSKLADFSDLERVTTLGFRGEALSSLCAIGTLSITTTQSPPIAHSLTFHDSGELNSQSICKRSKGTTLTISNLFHNLPVRLKDLTKNYKREFNKCIAFLQSYALMHTNVKFTVHNVSLKGKKTMVLHSQGLDSLKSNIISIFGSGGLQGLVRLDLTIDLNTMRSKLKLANVNEDYTVTIGGFVSKVGFGRASTDRQYLFINKRPVILKQWTKLFNEVYKTFSSTQLPVIILNLTIGAQFIDMNVTPDKRTVLIHNESAILDMVRSQLMEFYDSQDLSIPRNSSSQRLVLDDEVDEGQDTLSSIKSQFTYADSPTLVQSQGKKLGGEGHSRVKTVKFSDPVEEIEEVASVHEDETLGLSDLQAFHPDPQEASTPALSFCSPSSSNEDGLHDDEHHEVQVLEIEAPSPSDRPLKRVCPSSGPEFIYQQRPAKRAVQPTIEPGRKLTTLASLSAFRNGSTEQPVIQTRATQSTLQGIIKPRHSCQHTHHSSDSEEYTEDTEEDGDEDIEKGAEDEIEMTRYREVGTADAYETSVSIPEHFIKIMQDSKNEDQLVNFDDINDQEGSENYLTLTVSKKDFKEMKVIGQFNLGFVLVTRAKSDKRDLFIIDQHASDEKFNFEQLQRDTVFESQRLITPQSLELNVMDELLVIDHQDIFAKNGFQLKINMGRQPGERVQLISLPVFKRITFDTSDFFELIHLIKEQGTNLDSVRCSKVRSMFAMRACRKSIMVGKHLNHRQMSQVVLNLGDLDKPWNCPHGRPTMRHLMDLEWKPFNEDYTF